ncbi:MAG: hypothetical protein V4631_08390 [Pseudomonadota bacterium]
MSIDAGESVALPLTTLLTLREHLSFSESKLSVEQAVVLAIREWMANSGATVGEAGSEVLRGYQWKTLFLPESTQLRMMYAETVHYAAVVGESIMYRNRPVSPREFTMAIAGCGRNAWRDVWIRFPGSRQWKRANICRIEQDKKRRQPPKSPVDTMASAAAAMSDALKTALMLVEETSTQATAHVERRLAPLRRDDDRLHTDCSFD